jgi:hypothetical protein
MLPTLCNFATGEFSSNAVEALWGSIEVGATDVALLVAAVADPRRGEPKLTALALTILERLYKDTLSAVRLITLQPCHALENHDAGIDYLLLAEAIGVHSEVSKSAPIATHAAFLATAVLSSHTLRELKVLAVHTLSWALSPTTRSKQLVSSPLLSGPAREVVEIAWGGAFDLADTDMTMSDNDKTADLVGAPVRATSVLLNLIASHKPGLSLATLLANIVSQSPHPRLLKCVVIGGEINLIQAYCCPGID